MTGTKWSTEDKQLLKTDMSNDQIMKLTGRTEEAVRRARYVYTGHFVEKGRGIETKEEKLFQAEERYHKLLKEQRLKDLCKQLGVRLGGM